MGPPSVLMTLVLMTKIMVTEGGPHFIFRKRF